MVASLCGVLAHNRLAIVVKYRNVRIAIVLIVNKISLFEGFSIVRVKMINFLVKVGIVKYGDGLRVR